MKPNRFLKPQNPRILHNKDKKNRRIKLLFIKIAKAVLVLLIATLVPLLLYFLLDKAQLISIKEVYVTDFGASGLEYIEAEELQKTLLDKLKQRNIFIVTPYEVETEIKKYNQSQFIEKAYISKLFPSTIKVEIIERKPFLSIDTPEGCATVDKSSIVLEEEAVELAQPSTTEFTGGNCEAQRIKFGTYHLIYSKSDLKFKLGKATNLVSLVKVEKSVKVIEKFGYEIKSVFSEGTLLRFSLGNDATVTFSLNQNIDIQLKRLILVLKEVEDQKISFKTLDLRYERPALTR